MFVVIEIGRGKSISIQIALSRISTFEETDTK
jgi:hypothetical protein